MTYNNVSSKSLNDSVNLFAQYFQTNCNNDSLNSSCFDLNKINANVDFSSMSISEEDISRAINKLSNSFKSDNDGISSFLLKKCLAPLLLPLKIIFNNSIQHGYFIQKWKYTSVFPIHKSGSKNSVTNYRPISKLTNISKIFEHIVYEKISFQVKPFVSLAQHGFMPGRSTTTNLAVFNKFCISSFEKGFQVDTVYTDFAKAFDSVPHNLLLSKLKKLGFHSQMLSWFHSYLTGRISVVTIDGVSSEPFVPTSGVPQGSIIGPLLFIVFINDIQNCFKHSNFLLYADDLKIFKSVSNTKDISVLQDDLNRVSQWSSQNGLPFNINKCYVMTYHRCRVVIPSNYYINDILLSTVDEILDLGVLYDTKLTFSNHLNYIIPKAWSMFSFIRRHSDKYFDHHTKKVLFISFVRSRLEYASIIWNPSAITHSNRLEKIQKKFIKYALSFLNFSNSEPPSRSPTYSEKCMLLSMKTLESRRKMFSLSFLNNIVCGVIDCPDLLESIKLYVPSRSFRQREKLFYIDFHNTDYALNEPLTRSMRLFNEFSNFLDISIPNNDFKKILNNIL